MLTKRTPKELMIYVLLASLLAFTVGCSKNIEALSTDSPLEDGNYIVVLKKPNIATGSSASEVSLVSMASVHMNLSALSLDHQLGQALQTFSKVLQGGVYNLSAEQARALSEDARVAYIEKDQLVSIDTIQNSPPWGLDRLDQVSLPLNQSYQFTTQNQASVNAYVIDTGVLLTHQEFQTRAKGGYDFVDQDADPTDCNGHGTHVAGTIAGVTYGVAKTASVYAVRVLDCQGSGSISNVIAGVEWVTKNHRKPAVANMSLGGGVSQALDDAIKASVAAGVTFVVAAGNSNTNACSGSPARVSDVITVGSSTNTDARSSFSNFGTCVTLFAPGSDILSAWYTSSSSTNTISGTSMASPHVAGVAALYLAKNPSANPAQVKSALIAGSLQNKVSNPGTGSPNRLLNTLFIEGASGTDPGTLPPPVVTVLKNGAVVANLKADKGAELKFSLQVPATATNVRFEISGGVGDADLYVKKGTFPTSVSYDCRPYKGGNAESCSLTNANSDNTYFLILKGFVAFSGVTLKVNY